MTNNPNTAPEKDNKGTKKKVAIGAGIVAIIVLILLLLRSCGGTPVEENPSNTLTPGDGIISSEALEGMTQEEIQEMLNEQAAAGYITISMSPNVTFESGTAEGALQIENDERNLYSQIVEIYLTTDNGELGDKIYTSPVIPVGNFVNYGTLDVDLDAGTYDCIACFYNVDEDLNMLGQANAEIRITVQS